MHARLDVRTRRPQAWDVIKLVLAAIAGAAVLVVAGKAFAAIGGS